MNFFYILSGPLGYVMEWIYKLLPSYGWDIIIFTLLINIVKIPLQLSQQKSMAKMSAFQPMMMEIQNKYKDKPEKQQEEMLKLQRDYGYNPTAGCVPMLLNFLVMFGVIGVVYNPLERIFHISAAALTAAGEALTASGVAFTAITRDTTIISQLVAGNSSLAACFTPEQIATVTEFSRHMTFLGIDLTRVPKLGLSLDIVLPLLSVITMLLSTHIIEDVQSVCSRLLVLHQGRLRFDGTPEELIRAAEGHVGTFEARAGGREDGLHITARVNTARGVACRAVAETLPPYVRPAEPTLEDAYLYLISGEGEA